MIILKNNFFCFFQTTIVLFTLIPNILLSEEKSIQETYHRAYTFLFGFNYDVLNSSENFRSILKVYSDAYYRGFEARLENSKTKEVVGFTWTFLGKWFTFLLPHEFGHVLRTNQMGGSFTFVKFSPPGILGKLKLPSNATFEDHTVALIGGFEANYLTAKDVQIDFFRYNGLFNDEYGMAFAHRIMYPLYAFWFAPQNPRDPQTWIQTGGDPVNFTKLVWERGKREVFIKQNELLWEFWNKEFFPFPNPYTVVNPKLVKFYNDAAWASLLWNLLDINIYRQAHSFFGEQLKGKRPYFLGENWRWFYGTLFNPSVLGAELYFYNYIIVKKYFFTLYIKRGFPYKNNGIGFLFANLVNYPCLQMDLQVDFWDQEFYGKGLAIAPVFRWIWKENLNFVAQLGYKTKGYMLGKTIEKDAIGFVGIRYNLEN